MAALLHPGVDSQGDDLDPDIAVGSRNIEKLGLPRAVSRGNNRGSSAQVSTVASKGVVAQVLCVRLLSMKFDKVLEFALSVYAMRSAYHLHLNGTLAGRKKSSVKVACRKC
jgi:hypothetical protein